MTNILRVSPSASQLETLIANVNGFRLTTETGVPISSSDRTSQGTLYLTPYKSGQIGIFDGYFWKLVTATERSLSLTLTSGKNYDVFAYDNSGTLTLELSAAWTNGTTRADTLTTQNGVWVKSGAVTRRYLGTLRASSTNVIEDSAQNRLLWNMYNQIPRGLAAGAVNTSWSCTSTTYQQADTQAANRVTLVVGMAHPIDIRVDAYTLISVAGGNVGLGIDSTSTDSSQINSPNAYGAGVFPTYAEMCAVLSAGYHEINWIEKVGSGGTMTTYAKTYGNNSGIFGTVLA